MHVWRGKTPDDLQVYLDPIVDTESTSTSLEYWSKWASVRSEIWSLYSCLLSFHCTSYTLLLLYVNVYTSHRGAQTSIIVCVPTHTLCQPLPQALSLFHLGEWLWLYIYSMYKNVVFHLMLDLWEMLKRENEKSEMQFTLSGCMVYIKYLIEHWITVRGPETNKQP